ncbi:MAG: transcription termination/antitermination protein NusG [Candidatus Margulisiibacteriota bacterium]
MVENENLENNALNAGEDQNKPVEPVQGAPESESSADISSSINEPAVPEQPVAEEPKTLIDETVPVEEEEIFPKPVREAPKGEKRWFVIQAMTGSEDKVKKAIELTVESENLKDRVFQILVPTEETVEIKGGKRHERVRKMFPGYVFLEMILDDLSWYLIRQTQGVARFIGSKVQPTPVSDREMQRVLKQLGKEERLEVSFEKGEAVRVISGAFRGYTGTVDEVSAEKGKLKILINIFGRDTPVEVNFEHAQKIV